MDFSRRRFLAGTAAAIAAAPFARLLLEGEARGAAPGIAKRLVVVFTPNGTVHSLRRPTGSGTSFAFPKGSILEPLASVQDKLVVIDGLDFANASNHAGGMAAMLTANGKPGDPGNACSIDQLVAGSLGTGMHLPSLDLGVQTSDWGGDVQTRMAYAPGGAFVTPDDDPANVFTRLFGDVGQSADQRAAQVARRHQVYQLALSDVTKLHDRLGPVEQKKLEVHLASLQQLDGSLQQPQSTCAAPVPPNPPANLYDHANFGIVGQQQMDLLVASLACDLTRVATLQWSHTVAPQVLSYLGLSQGHHDLSHSDDSNTEGLNALLTAERWFASQFAYLVDKLATTADPANGGMLLDSTLVVWAKEMGDSRLHVCTDVPFVLAGSAGGRFQTGRYLRYSGEPHNQLLVSIAQAMGLSTTTFGDPANGSGPLAGLT